jgi:hypothetical protein
MHWIAAQCGNFQVCGIYHMINGDAEDIVRGSLTLIVYKTFLSSNSWGGDHQLCRHKTTDPIELDNTVTDLSLIVTMLVSEPIKQQYFWSIKYFLMHKSLNIKPMKPYNYFLKSEARSPTYSCDTVEPRPVCRTGPTIMSVGQSCQW